MAKEDVVEAWLGEFKGKNTNKVYRSILRKFQRHIGIDLNVYLRQKRDFLGDFKEYVASLDNAPKTTLLHANTVKQFLKEQRVLKLSDEEWKKIRKRRELVAVPITQDRAPTREELRRILNYLDVRGRALVLFLISTGARIGETLQLCQEDLDLESDPPKAAIRPQNTKGIVGGRVVRMSYEARDAIKDWLKIKHSLKKKSGENFEEKLVFPMTDKTAREIWVRAVAKAGLNQKDPDTNRLVLHIHSLRKFFRSNIGLDFDLTNALMGHYAYLDRSYRRLSEADIDKAFSTHMANVSLYSAPVSRKEEIRRALAMQGLKVEDVIEIFQQEMLKEGVGSGGGVSLKLPIDEDYVASLEDEEIGKYAFKALKRKLLGEKATSGPQQKIIPEDELEAYLTKGWRYVNSLNNGSQKCVIARP